MDRSDRSNSDSRAVGISIVVAARNEEAYIGRCLAALLAQQDCACPVEVIVAANACTDDTVAAAQATAGAFAARGWTLRVLELADGGKIGALNAADGIAAGPDRVYLDADVICEPALLRSLARAMAVRAPRYVTGRLSVRRGRSAITRGYARVWVQLPFVKGGAVGAGLFAVNAAGRRRWGAWPQIISDDTFARLNFAPDERIEVDAVYHWPMVEGWRNLVRVRRRQDAGVAEVHRMFPHLGRNEGKAGLTAAALARLAVAAPFGLGVYLLVHLAVRSRPATADWTRGR